MDYNTFLIEFTVPTACVITLAILMCVCVCVRVCVCACVHACVRALCINAYPSLQVVTPFYVSTKLSGVSTTSFFVPSAEAFARAAVATIGIQRSTLGCFPHALMVRVRFCPQMICKSLEKELNPSIYVLERQFKTKNCRKIFVLEQASHH